MKNTFLIGFLFFVICGCINTQKKAMDAQARKAIDPFVSTYIDTSRYAILNFDKHRDSSIFNKGYQPALFSADDIYQIERLIKIAADKYNKKSGKYSHIDKSYKYYKQFIAVINSKGEKEVFVNCMCDLEGTTTYWKKSIVEVADGGPCYFNCKINLTKNNLYDLVVNGAG